MVNWIIVLYLYLFGCDQNIFKDVLITEWLPILPASSVANFGSCWLLVNHSLLHLLEFSKQFANSPPLYPCALLVSWSKFLVLYHKDLYKGKGQLLCTNILHPSNVSSNSKYYLVLTHPDASFTQYLYTFYPSQYRKVSFPFPQWRIKTVMFCCCIWKLPDPGISQRVDRAQLALHFSVKSRDQCFIAWA